MSNNSNFLFILPFYNRENWTADYQKQTVNKLSKRYSVVVYCEYNKTYVKELISLRKKPIRLLYKSKGVYYYSQVDLLPFIRFETVKRINAFINALLLFLLIRKNLFSKKIVVWGFHPEVADFRKYFPFRNYSIYDCVDFFSSVIPEHSRIIKRQEKYIMNKFDLVTVNSTILLSHHKKVRENIKLVPLGFSPPSKKITAKRSLPGDRPIIGYAGALNYRLDYKLLRKLVEGNKQWMFVFWGPRQKDIQDSMFDVDKEIEYLFSLPNVIHGQSTTRDNVYSMIKQFDICIIPYNTKLDFNKYCFPMKLFEYFYVGKPVMSTSIKELGRYPKFIKIGDSVKEWEDGIKMLLGRSWPADSKMEERLIAEENRWEKKINEIIELINNGKKF
ncbi:hypothetical protein M1271_04350 [Patescibacteria group bacterium]|nr:hypothetical protein [Patescibacteria group bacterium]